MDNFKLFSDDLPVRLPVWHSVQSSNKNFSRLRNQFDLDVIPDYGGHMLNYDKRTGKFEQIKHDHLCKSPFIIRSHLIPYRISLESTRDMPNKKSSNRCLVYDENQLISTLSFDHPKRKEIIIHHFNSTDHCDFDGDTHFTYREYFDFSHGNIEQVNKFVNVTGKLMTHVRQEQCVNLFEFKKSSFIKENQWIKTGKIVPQNPDEFFFYSDQNSIIGQYLITGSTLDSQVRINEMDIELNSKFWSTSLQQADKAFQINYSKYHPRMFYLITTSDVSIFDTRIKSTGNLNISRNKLRSLSSIEKFQQFSNSISNPNQLFIATDYNLMQFDVRYPNYVLMQWSHMLSSDSELSHINCIKLEAETVFVGTREEIACISIDKPSSENLIQPTSLHFPIHLPKFKNMIKNSTVSDLHLEKYINRGQIVGFDFVMKDEKEFDLYLMNQYGDLFKQQLSKTDLKNPDENVMQLESNLKTKLDNRFKTFKEKLFEQRKEELKTSNFLKNDKLKTGQWQPTDRTFWSKFADDLELNKDDLIKQEINDAKEELETDELVKLLKSNLSDAIFIDKLEKVFKANTKEFISNNVSNYKWSEYTMRLFEAWNLNQNDLIDESADEHMNTSQQASQNPSQDYILSQYI